MCFAPQQRALFQHLNFQKCSEHDVFCAFWLGNVLRATTACTFSTSQLPKVLRTWCVLCILTWKCASRHNGMHFFDIATSKSAPNVLFFLAFSLANVLRATTGWTFSTSQLRKALQTWSVFSFFTCIYASRHKRACNFSWPNGSVPAALASPLFDPPEPQIIGKTQCFATFLPFHAPGSYFFRDFLFFDLLSSSLLFSDSSHLCFSSVHIVGSLTSKLPSANILFIYQLEKWLQSFGRPEQSLRYKIPFNNQINNRPCRIAPKKKSNRTDLRCISQIKSHTFRWDSLMCEILPLKSFSVAILSLSWWRKYWNNSRGHEQTWYVFKFSNFTLCSIMFTCSITTVVVVCLSTVSIYLST